MFNKRRMSPEQVEDLVMYMETHSLFCRCQIMSLGGKGDEKYDKMCLFLANRLNNIGPAIKSISSWKEVSIDYT